MKRRQRTYIETGKKERRKAVFHLDMVFFLSFFVGIVWANLLGENSKNRFFMLNEYYLQQLKYMDIDHNGLFLYILENRLPLLLLLILLSFTLAGILVQILFVGYFGASFGFLCVMAITNFGWKGIVYIGGFLFPHYIFYLIFYLLFLKLLVRKKDGMESGGKEWMMQTGILAALLVLGLLSESYVNPVFLQRLIKILG